MSNYKYSTKETNESPFKLTERLQNIVVSFNNAGLDLDMNQQSVKKEISVYNRMLLNPDKSFKKLTRIIRLKDKKSKKEYIRFSAEMGIKHNPNDYDPEIRIGQAVFSWNDGGMLWNIKTVLGDNNERIIDYVRGTYNILYSEESIANLLREYPDTDIDSLELLIGFTTEKLDDYWSGSPYSILNIESFKTEPFENLFIKAVTNKETLNAALEYVNTHIMPNTTIKNIPKEDVVSAVIAIKEKSKK